MYEGFTHPENLLLEPRRFERREFTPSTLFPSPGRSIQSRSSSKEGHGDHDSIPSGYRMRSLTPPYTLGIPHSHNSLPSLSLSNHHEKSRSGYRITRVQVDELATCHRKNNNTPAVRKSTAESLACTRAKKAPTHARPCKKTRRDGGTEAVECSAESRSCTNKQP